MEDLSRPVRPGRRIRLLWLIDSLTVGGAESLVVPFANRLDRDQYDLYICCLTSIAGNKIEERLRSEDFQVLNLESRNLRDLSAFRKLLRFVRENQIDIIHAHLTYAATWSALVSRLTGVPSVASLHVAPPTEGRSAVRDLLMRFVLNRWSASVISVSGALRDRYLAAGGLAPSRMRVVHNGIEVERFHRDRLADRSALLRQLDIPHASRIILTVSVLRPGKGIEVLLQSVKSVVERVPNACFVIVGDGPMRDEWTSQAASLGISEHVRWAGYRNDVERILPAGDLFVLPSLDDAFPTVLLEAMAAGLPVVATDVGGIPEIVVPGVTGRLVPPGKPEPLAEAIAAMLLENETELSHTRLVARQIAADQFSTDAWIARLDAVYRDILSERETPRA